MKCRELKKNIQHYSDGELSDAETSAVTEHLNSCPVCRAELESIGSLRRELRGIRIPRISASTLHSIHAAVRAELPSNWGSPNFFVFDKDTSWVHKWLFPSTVGVCSTVVLATLLFALILLPAGVPNLTMQLEPREPVENAVYLANASTVTDETKITPLQFAHSRADISNESPSLNPDGTLVEMTGDQNRDEEMVVVADVYENGSAEITDVVKSPRDRKLIDKLQYAMRTDSARPPFVPARMDNRDNFVRVVLKLQSVNVNVRDEDPLR